jgi:hypothetical protein
MSRHKGRPSRRSFLRTVVGGAALSGATSIISGAHAQHGSWSAEYAACRTGVTDSDGGEEADPVGNGRGTGITDSDSGTEADRGGYGQGTGVTDEDSGESADRAGYGRGARTYTDRDRGAHADPAGEGRGPVRVTDTDTGFGSDPIGRGQGGDRIRAASSRPCPETEPQKDGDR